MAETGDSFRHNMHVYNLYLRCEDAILAILCMGLCIATIISGEWLKKFNNS